MVDLNGIEIIQAETADPAAVRSFYSSVGYGCDLKSDDRIIVAIQDQSIVAAARLCFESDTLVLRGMYVAEMFRGMGIGLLLLERISKEIGSSSCWCIPYSDLESFYSRIGFRVGCGEIPAFLAIREKKYLAAGQEVMVMQRPRNWGKT